MGHEERRGGWGRARKGTGEGEVGQWGEGRLG